MDSPTGNGGITFTAVTPTRAATATAAAAATTTSSISSFTGRARARSSLSGRRHGICDAEAMGSLWPRIHESNSQLQSTSTELMPALPGGDESERRRSSLSRMRAATMELLLLEEHLACTRVLCVLPPSTGQKKTGTP